MSIVFNGKTIAGAPPQSDTANAAKKADLTSIIATGATNATGATITSGTFFYLNGTLVQALADIASGATFTENTNFEVPSAGSLNALKSALDIESGTITTSNIGAGTSTTSLLKFNGLVVAVFSIGALTVNVPANTWVAIGSIPIGFRPGANLTVTGIATDTNGNPLEAARCMIKTGGTIQFKTKTSYSVSSTYSISIGGIFAVYKAEN